MTRTCTDALSTAVARFWRGRYERQAQAWTVQPSGGPSARAQKKRVDQAPMGEAQGCTGLPTPHQGALGADSSICPHDIG